MKHDGNNYVLDTTNPAILNMLTKRVVDGVSKDPDDDSPFPKCKICFQYKNPVDATVDLISPCGCKGSIKWVHKSCLRLWRFKGKHIREIKKCEQCCCEYKIEEDFLPHRMIVRATSLFSIAMALIVTNCAVNSVLDAVTFLLEETLLEERKDVDRLTEMFRNSNIDADTINASIYNLRYRNLQRFLENKEFQKEGKTSYTNSTVFAIMIYIFLCRWNFWPAINFFFTVWRIYYFNWTIDKIILTVYSIYYLKKIHNDLFDQIDTMYVFLLNYRS